MVILSNFHFRGRRALEDMANYLEDLEKRHTDIIESYRRHNKLFMNLQSGIATLLEKLKEVRLKPVSLKSFDPFK